MTASPIPNAKARFFNLAGTGPLAGGKLYTYVAGSPNTPKATYIDYNKSSSNTNPVILDSAGEADIWLDGNYKLYLTDANDVAQWANPIDNVQSINQVTTTYTTTGSPNAYVLTPSPAITSYAGSSFTFIASFTNTGASTLNVNGLGATALKKNGSIALVAGDIVSGQMYTVTYDGTNFQVLNINSSFTTLNVSGLATFGGNIEFSTDGDGIIDANGNKLLVFAKSSSAVNSLVVNNSATGGNSGLSVQGSSPDIGISIITKGAGEFDINSFSAGLQNLSGSSAAPLKFYEGVTNGSNYIGLKASDSLSANTIFTLPGVDGTANQTLVTDGSANLSFIGISTLGTVTATTSGTSIDFVSIPAGVKQVVVEFQGLSTSGTSIPMIQIGPSGGIEATGYLGAASGLAAGATTANFTTGFGLAGDSIAASIRHGSITLSLMDASNNIWVASGVNARSDTNRTDVTGGSKPLAGVLNRLRLTTVGGSDTFDAGSVNIKYQF
jgi:hypothetical protein